MPNDVDELRDTIRHLAKKWRIRAKGIEQISGSQAQANTLRSCAEQLEVTADQERLPL